eukprot:jgi/Sobl393_1/1193/SZX71361.1
MAEAVSWSQQSLPAPGQPQQSPPRQCHSQQQDQAANGAAAGQQPQQQVLDSTPASRQQHAGTKGQLAVQVKHEESMPQDLLYSTGAAASDVAQDTTVGAAPAPAPAPPSSTPAMPDSTRGSNAPAAAGSRELGASSPSAGDNDSTPGPASAQLTAGAAAADGPDPAAAEAAECVPPPPQQQVQPDHHQQQQQQQQQQYGTVPAAAFGGEGQGPEHGAAAAAAAGDAQPAEQQQQQQQQQQEQVPQFSLGLELLGEAAGLLPQDGPMSAAAAAATAAATMHPHAQHHLQQQQHPHQGMYLPGAAAATPRPRVPSGSGRKDGSGRQARVSLNQLMLEGSKYGEPSMPMLTKPDGVACQVPGCHANLNAAGVSTYFRRHRVCLSHAKADQVLISGIAMRFCQQCGIMHPLPDFDGSRKSCRVQLDRHNLRRRCRRKTQTQSNKAAAAAAAAAAGGTRNRGGGNCCGRVCGGGCVGL